MGFASTSTDPQLSDTCGLGGEELYDIGSLAVYHIPPALDLIAKNKSDGNELVDEDAAR